MRWSTTQPSLLVRLRDPDDQRAWAEFDDRYGELIVRYCRRRGLQQCDAEDIRQIVLMNLSRAMGGFRYARERGRFRGYLGRIVRNAIARWATRRPVAGRAFEHDLIAARPETDERWEEEWVRQHLRRGMRQIRRTFDAGSVDVFDRLLAGASTATVAREMSMRVEAVHKVKQRVRDRLKTIIAEQIEQENRVGA